MSPFSVPSAPSLTFADDVAALIEQRRAAGGAGVSEIVNDLVRRGAVAERRSTAPPPLPAFDMGMLIDVRNVGVPDVELAALAYEHGLTVCSADHDFARFTEIRWLDPLA